VIEALFDPLGHGATARAVLEVVLLATLGGALGSWIVLYRLSYAAESLAHGLFPGLVLAALTGLPLILGGALGLAVAGLGVALASRGAADPDTAVGIVVTTMFGAGALLALSADSPPGLGNLLFGGILGVSAEDLAVAGGLTAAVLLGLWCLHPRLLAVGFDRSAAGSLGVRVLAVDAALLGLIGAGIVVALEGMGNLLVVAVLIGPAATARLLSRRVGPMVALATACGMVAGVGGIYLSYYADTAAGASVAGCIVLLYLSVLVATALSGGSRQPGYDR
jgi:ABC-type Mn2+/Zn2+ transport system permease subunit